MNNMTEANMFGSVDFVRPSHKSHRHTFNPSTLLSGFCCQNVSNGLKHFVKSFLNLPTSVSSGDGGSSALRPDPFRRWTEEERLRAAGNTVHTDSPSGQRQFCACAQRHESLVPKPCPGHDPAQEISPAWWKSHVPPRLPSPGTDGMDKGDPALSLLTPQPPG